MEETSLLFSSALSAWKDINLQDLQKLIDKQGIEIVENQKESLIGRKKLAEQTRDFKKNPEYEKTSGFKPLLKAYQTEIDALTKRSKMAENAFLNVYKLLAEAPDPYPLLDAAVDQTALASQTTTLTASLAAERETSASLRAELAEAQKTARELKKAADSATRLETHLEDLVRERVAAKEAEIRATYDERLRNDAERERDAADQLARARAQLRELRATHDVSQARLVGDAARADEATLDRLASAELIAQDLERANARVVAVEHRNEQLRAELAAAQSGSGVTAAQDALEAAQAELAAESARLLRTLDAQNERAAAAAAEAEKKADSLQRALAEREAETQTLRARLQGFSDYDEIRRELAILKSVEFGGQEDWGWGEGDAAEDGPSTEGPPATAAPLETLLLARNRKLQDELTALRVAYEEVAAAAAAADSRGSALEADLAAARRLAEKLESDLAHVKKSEGSSGTVGTTAGAGPPPTSILPIITSQRDRFRQRNSELEEELRRQFETLSELRAEIKTLQADNAKLYEKVRYLQSYGGRDGRDGYGRHAGGTSVDLDAYKSRYEESVNPFEAFRGRELTRASRELNILEKLLLKLSKSILVNRFTRHVFIIYALFIHFMVMYVLYGYMGKIQEDQILAGGGGGVDYGAAIPDILDE